MRRKEREIKDFEKMMEILKACDCCRIGLVDGDEAYIVPMNFGYEVVDNKLILYFHCAKEGRKMSALLSNPAVCVEMDCEHRLVEGVSACEYGYSFASIIGNGRAVVVEDIEEKKHGLSVLMSHQTGKEFSFDDAQAGSVAVVRIDLETFTGKRRQ